MHQYFFDFRLLVITLYTLFLFSCNVPAIQETGGTGRNLFGPSQTDSNLFQNVIDSTKILLSPDTAYAHSDLVVTAHMVSIDSMVHHKERAPFYLITVLTDSCLKGQISLTRQRLYFISYRLLSINRQTGSMVCFLKGIKEKNLMQGTGVIWQWLDHAPVNSAPADFTICPKAARTFRSIHLHYHKKTGQKSAAP